MILVSWGTWWPIRSTQVEERSTLYNVLTEHASEFIKIKNIWLVFNKLHHFQSFFYEQAQACIDISDEFYDT